MSGYIDEGSLVASHIPDDLRRRIERSGRLTVFGETDNDLWWYPVSPCTPRREDDPDFISAPPRRDRIDELEEWREKLTTRVEGTFGWLAPVDEYLVDYIDRQIRREQRRAS